MQREIKFRGLGIDGKWWFGESNPSGENHVNLATFFANLHPGAIRPETVGEHTGLKDANGKGQYEGDIKDYGMYTDPKFGRCLHIIYWDDESACFAEREFGFQKQSGFPIDPTGEVIGNIYQNKELLEVKNG